MKEPDRIEIKKDGTHYFLDAKEVSEKQYRARHPLPQGEGVFMTSSKSGWPYVSNSEGCHPVDRQAFMDAAAKAGVPTVFNEQGKAVFTSREHQKRYCKAFGKANFDENWSGGGDKRPPKPPKKRPKMGKQNLVTSMEPPQMRTATRDAEPRRRRKPR